MTDKSVDLSHFIATWDITRACNFHCIHCISGASKRWSIYELSTADARRVIRQIGELKIGKVSWSGGEPLIRDDLEEIMRHGLKHGIKSYDIVSNGYFITRDRAKRLVDAGLEGIQISIDGIDPQQNSLLRKGPPDCFSRALNAIEVCIGEGLSVVLGTMLYPEMISRLDAMYDLAVSLGVDMLRFSGFVPNGRGGQAEIRERMRLSFEQMTVFLRFLRGKYYQDPGFVGLDYSFSLDPFIGTFASSEGRDHFFIDYKGDVFPSTGSERGVFKVGNALEESLAEILSRPSLVHSLPSRSELIGKCQECCKFDECGGGPRGLSYMFSGDHLQSPELCLFHEYNLRSHRLGDPSWPRMLSGLTQNELREIDVLITRLLDKGGRWLVHRG
jgi:radical SAM protein with 4Fe4S-binding SPASM domain